MSIKVKPGRWRERGGGIATVEERLHPATQFQWFGRDSLNWPSLWSADGSWLRPGLQHQYDLIEYLGPEEQTGGVQSDLVEFLGDTEDDLGSIKHNAAKALVASAESLKSMLNPEEDGRYAISVAEFIVLNARVLEALTRPEIADDDEIGGER